mgnify:CR=1 FL=1
MGACILSEYFLNIYDTVKTMISGMSLTLKHLRKKKELVATLQYPNEKWPIPERNIGFDNSEYNVIRSRLHVDIDDCIGCLQCEKACPVDCIKIDTLKPSKGSDFDCGKTSNDSPKKMLVPRFTIDMSECMYCNLCVYPCPEECIYMVGGPNEPKHDIDYEFSKYSKHDLIFEFSNVSETQILEAGGQDYLNEKKEISDKVKKGEKLEGGDLAVSEDSPSSEGAGPKRSKGIDKAFALFKKVPDSKMKAVVRKSIAYGRRNSDQPEAIISTIKNLLNNNLSSELESALNEFKAFNYGDSANNNSSQSGSSSTTVVSTELFEIKEINIIEDKLLRANLKKIYMGGKKNKSNSNIVVDEMLSHLKSKGIEDAKIIDHLKSLKINEENPSNQQASSADSIPVSTELFEIKEINIIEDKLLRANLKKIYMVGKKNKSNSDVVVTEILSLLEEKGIDDSTVINHLNSLKLSQQNESNVNKQEIDNQVKDSALFDMKLLNGIDDKVARGTAKKVYIGCKKDNKSSAEVIEEIKNSISSAGLMNENVEKILGELG